MKILHNSICFYCGEGATAFDHVIPYSRLTNVEKRRNKHAVGVIIPTCHECNNLLGARLFDNIYQRALYVNKKLKKKYRTAIDATLLWGEEEIQEMHGKLKDMVLQNIQTGEVAYDRVMWIERPEFFKNLEEAQDEINYRFPHDKMWRVFFMLAE